jgi:hypothetical protein
VKIAHKIIALDATKPPSEAWSSARQYQEREELRGAKHHEPPRTRQHSEPDCRDQLVQGRDHRRHRIAVGEVGSDPDQGDKRNQHGREDQRPMAQAIIIRILGSRNDIGQSIQKAHD